MNDAVVQLQKPIFAQILDFIGEETGGTDRETPTAAVVTGSVADHLSVFASLVAYIRATPMRDQRMLQHIAVLQSTSCHTLQAALSSLVQQLVTADLPEVIQNNTDVSPCVTHCPPPLSLSLSHTHTHIFADAGAKARNVRHAGPKWLVS